MNDLPIPSYWTTMDRGFAPHHCQEVTQYAFYVRLARGLSEWEAAQCVLAAGDHRETLD